MIVWLAKFHADFFETDVSGLWPAGSYWDLQRPHRLSAMKDIEAESDLERDLIAFASDFDSEIKKCSFQTIIHGDAKVENFCFSENGEVAGLDFQWVGKGTGLRDLMCLISSCVKSEELIQESLDFYFSSLSDHLPKMDNFEAIEREWRQIWPFVVADFERFLLSWNRTHWKRTEFTRKMSKIACDLLKAR